ncbi:type VI secretion system lipoprotein TssJ [Vibrio sp. SCSIO 43137]|uniref:type VI secretion system lipoprotein TssJ n=1 Tax=Vibrio sp. SCSIO 43137 TaxID=3021011 RepID=UPI002306F9F3|nr:type VI secretion system lipoprotein TssJ [Vibrio sp. SCSIO 43137]WCE31030.1 type VI secretion system lipoprotein TssJ [Vibrio sp. SCSIO 43137]
MKKLFVSLIAATLLSACSFFDDEVIQPKLTVKITAQDNINPNVNGKASPLELRIYQLSDDDAFNQASFLQLYSDDQGALKSGLTAKRHLPSILPGETREEEFPLVLDSRYIAVLGAFANYREAKSKAIYKIDQFGLVTVNISVDGLNVSISGTEEE